MRLALAAVVAVIPFVSAFADHAQHGKRMHHARQAPPVSSSPSSANTATTSKPAPPASTSPPAPAPTTNQPGQPGNPTTPGAPPPAGTPSSAAVPPGQTSPPASVPSMPPTVSFSLLATNPTAVPLASINANAPSVATSPLDSTVAPGTQPTFIPGAPSLPNIVQFNPANYPPLDKIPPVDSPEVQQWKQEVANSGISIPSFSQTVAGGCPTNPDAIKDTSRCWWTCGGCTRDSDITDCPEAKHWGLTYDDGPGFYTSQLLDYLDEKQLKSTFFVVGSRVISFPATLQAEYMGQHQIAVHTWSHPALTTLTNDEIIAELGWTKKAIKDVLGVTPNMMRPPFGDIDDRVRAISMAMGLTPVMWTRISTTATFDTDDFNIHSGLTSVSQVLQNWQNILGNVTTRDRGFVVLEHDLFQQTVEVATGYILPDALARGLTIEPVSSCFSMPLANAYIETNDNKTHPPPSGTGAATIPGTSTTNPGGSGVGAGSGGGQGGQDSGAAETFRVGAVVAVTTLAGVLTSIFTLL